MADQLTNICNKYGCDKSDKNHRYTSKYHERFSEYRNSKFNMLEYGFGVGNSVNMWLEYFTKINLVTVDVRPIPNDKRILQYIKDGRLEYIVSSQIDKDMILLTLKKYNEFFVIIDDASHVAEDQQYTLEFSFPFVTPGGWYVIEDLKCKRNHNTIAFATKADKTLKVLQNYIQTKKFRSKILTEQQNLEIEKNIEDVKIFDKIAFIKKRR